MTQEQHIARSHWFRFGSSGFPIQKVSKGWVISIESTSLWAAVGTRFPVVFKTKKAAVEFFDNLCLERFREWRELDEVA